VLNVQYAKLRCELDWFEDHLSQVRACDKQQKIVFIPIASISKAVDQDGVMPVRYGDLLQLVRQLGEDNQRLKAENDHLWKVAENRSGSPASVIVQQSPPPQPDPDAERRQMRTMLLRSLLNPRSTVNVNVRIAPGCLRFAQEGEADMIWLGMKLAVGAVLGFVLCVAFGLCCGAIALIKSTIDDHRLANR
jgi:hypothetical protein